MPEETFVQVWSIRLMAAFTVSWFFCLGACLGSFLNVIVWRWPQGRSLISEPSACPVCQTPILWSDNIPILGWLRLRGRCRNCGTAISSRYPLVEALVGLQFVVLLSAEALTGGATLPVRPIDQYAGVVWIIWYAMQPDLLRIYAWHLSLLYLANILWLIDEDRRRVPWTILPIVTIIGPGCAAAFPDLQPLLNLQLFYDQSFTWRHHLAGLQAAVVGGLVGSLISWISVAVRNPVADRRAFACLIMYFASGIVLGWQAVISCALIAVMLRLAKRPFARHFDRVEPRSLLFAIWLALPIHLLSWRWLDSSIWWPGSRSPWYVPGIAMVVIVFSNRWLSIKTAEQESDVSPRREDEEFLMPTPVGSDEFEPSGPAASGDSGNLMTFRSGESEGDRVTDVDRTF